MMGKMRAKISIGFILLVMGSCIEPFYPEINESRDLIVINGRITDKPGEHFVAISHASSYNDPAFDPVIGCLVRVEDELGRGIMYEEYEAGRYRAILDKSFLGINKAYKLFVFTEEGKEYQSDYDTLFEGPPLDSAYYFVEYEETENPDITYGGFQFYVNAKGEGRQSKNFMWELEQTFEYRSPFNIQYRYSRRRVTEIDPPIDSLAICFMTQTIPELFTSSTKYLSSNELSSYPLHYVSGRLPYLKYRYSLLISQYSLSDEAFQYWEGMKNQHKESGGIFERQPSNMDGNIYNSEDAGEKVLGYFHASQVHQKRIIINNAPPFQVLDYTCTVSVVGSLREAGLTDPQYLISYSTLPTGPPFSSGGTGPPYGDVRQDCLDCRQRGGTLSPPPYWTNKHVINESE